MKEPRVYTIPTRREILAGFLATGQDAWVHLDARRPQVHVPAEYKDQAGLVLQLGHAMPVPMVSYSEGPEGFGVRLEFNSGPASVWVPWHAVWCLRGTGDEGEVWFRFPYDTPGERPVEATEPKKRGHLRLV